MADLNPTEPGQGRRGSAVFVIDASGIVRVAEGDGLAALGVVDEATGRLAASLFGSRPRLLAALHHVLAGEADRLELSVDRQTFEMTFEPRRGGGALVLAENVTAPRRLRAEERATERDLVLALRATPGAIWTTDRDLRFTFLRGRALETVGLARTRIDSLTVHELMSARGPSDPIVVRHLDALAGHGQSFRYAFKGRTFEIAIEPLRGGQGAIRGCVGMALDVTDHSDAGSGTPGDCTSAAPPPHQHPDEGVDEPTRTAERARRRELEHSLSIARAAIDAAADGILVVDTQGRIVAYNQRFLAMWGIPHEFAEQREDERLVGLVRDQLEDPDGFMRGVRELYVCDQLESFDVLHFKDGRVFERYSIPQRVGDRVVGRVWSFRDVTERDRLLRRAEFFSDATRLLGSLDVEKALDSVAHLVVESVAEVCAVDLVDGTGMRRLFVVSRAGASADTRNPQPPVATLAGHSSVYAMGTTSCLSVPLKISDRTIGAITFVAPPCRRYLPTDLAFAEELARRAALAVENAHLYRASQEALRSREEFLSVAAHEIRGPIASMHLAVQGLRQGLVANATQPKALEIIEREDRRLTRFVDELLDINHVRTGRLSFSFESVDLAEVARTVASRFAAELARSGSSLALSAAGGTIGHWDRFRLEQVVTNLLGNAIKFGQGKPIDVSVLGYDGRTKLTVRDRGVGIPAGMLEPIFRPFERAVSSRHYGGLGLGLYIVEAIVHGLGGTVKALSPGTGGACFVVDLPQARPRESHEDAC